MNTDTLEKMKKMRMLGMHRIFQTSLETARNENLTPDEMITLLVDSEWDDRHNRSIEREGQNVPSSVTRQLLSNSIILLNGASIKIRSTALVMLPLSQRMRI